MLIIVGMLGIFGLIWNMVYRTSNIRTPSTTFECERIRNALEEARARRATIEEGEDSLESIPVSIPPPPPYHIAVTLPTDAKDVPPPSYDCAMSIKETT